MEGIIFDIKRFAINDGPGIRTTIFLKGCPLDCPWCHNPESKKFCIETQNSERKIGTESFTYQKQVGKKVSVNHLLEEISKEKLFMDTGDGGVTLSGGEPLAQLEFCTELLRNLKTLGYHTAIDTSGAVQIENIKQILPYTDLFLYDLKSLNPYIYYRKTGKSLRSTLTGLELLMEEKASIIMRIPVIPGVNLSATDAERMALYLSRFENPNFKEVHLLPFHKLGKGKMPEESTHFLNITPEPSQFEIDQFADPFIEQGFEVSIH